MNPTSTFTLADLQPARPIQGWEDFLENGQDFLKTAQAAYTKRNKVFTAEILYNIIAMAIEKFVMAVLMHHGAMPYNHTMADLAAAMEETFPGEINDIRARLLRLDAYQQICDLDGFSIAPPAMTEIPAMLELADTLKSLVVRRCITVAENSKPQLHAPSEGI